MNPNDIQEKLLAWTIEHSGSEQRAYLGMSRIGECSRVLYRELMTFVIADASTIERANWLLWVAHNLERVMIVDYDVHHGNGTQDIGIASDEEPTPLSNITVMNCDVSSYHIGIYANNNHLYNTGVDTLLAEYDYDLAADGKRTGVTEKTLVDSALEETRIDWLYDGVGRLTQEQYDSYDNDLDYTATYSFDLVGNRLQETTDKGNDSTVDETITYQYDANDRLLAEAKDDSTVANEDRFTVYEYGANNTGTQQTSKTVYEGLDASGTKLNATTYTYNLQGRMSKAEIDSDGDGTVDSTSEYQYDDSGIRVSQTVDGQKTDYLIDHFSELQPILLSG